MGGNPARGERHRRELPPGSLLGRRLPVLVGMVVCEENPTTYPRKLPTPVMTAPVGRVRHFGSPGSAWELRLIRAESPGDETYAAPCPERPGKRR